MPSGQTISARRIGLLLFPSFTRRLFPIVLLLRLWIIISMSIYAASLIFVRGAETLSRILKEVLLLIPNNTFLRTEQFSATVVMLWFLFSKGDDFNAPSTTIIDFIK